MLRYVLILSLFALTACSSHSHSACIQTADSQQILTIHTSPIGGAMCRLSNDQGNWLITSTPGSVSVHRSQGKLTITCEKPGYLPATQVLESSSHQQSVLDWIERGFGESRKVEVSDYAYPADITIVLFLAESSDTHIMPK